MIPLRDNQPTKTFPTVTILLIAANIVVYIAQQTMPLEASFSLVPFEITHHIAHRAPLEILTNSGIRYLVPPSPHPIWITLFTSMFLHGSLLHIGGNMLYLWIFGNNIEDALGKWRYLFFLGLSLEFDFVKKSTQ